MAAREEHREAGSRRSQEDERRRRLRDDDLGRATSFGSIRGASTRRVVARHSSIAYAYSHSPGANSQSRSRTRSKPRRSYIAWADVMKGRV